MSSTSPLDAAASLTLVLDALLVPPDQSAGVEWGMSVVRAVCELVHCEGAKLSVRTPAEPCTFFYGATDTRQPCGAVLRVTAAIPDGVRVALVCHLSDAQSTPQNVDRCRAALAVLQPALAAAARMRFAPHTSDGLVSLLDALTEPVAACAADGRIVHENEAFRHLVAREPRDAELRSAIAHIAGAAAREAPRSPARQETITDPSRYELVARRASSSGGAALVLVTVRRVGQVDVLLHPTGEFDRRFGLSRREAEVVRLLVAGWPNADIARALGISEATARHHTQRVLEKLGVRSRAAVPSRVMAHS